MMQWPPPETEPGVELIERCRANGDGPEQEPMERVEWVRPQDTDRGVEMNQVERANPDGHETWNARRKIQ
jgi:hypothetical protein